MSNLDAQASAGLSARSTTATGRMDSLTLAVLTSVPLSYTIVNMALREFATKLNPYLVAVFRLFPLLVISLIAVARSKGGLSGLFRRLNGSSQGRRTMFWLVVSGMLAYFLGNSIFQTALKLGGIGIGVPGSQGGSIWGSILIGLLLFGERVTPTKLLGIAVMASGLVLLAMGRPSHSQAGLGSTITAVALSIAAGITWTTPGIVLRKLAYPLGLTTLEALMFNAIGCLVLLIPATIWTAGPTLSTVPMATLGIGVIAGLFNACGLLGTGFSFNRTTFVTVNLFTASSVALSTLLGILIFREPSNAYIWSGLTAVLAGLAIVQLSPVGRERRSVLP